MSEYAEEKLQQQIDHYDRKLLKKVERRGRRNLRTISLLTGLALAETLYWTDVRHNEEIEANASIDIEVISEAIDPDTSDSAIVFLNGFGENDADVPARYFGPAIQEHVLDGETWSVGYGNAPLIELNIADEIIELAGERGIDRVSFFGYSAGGNIAIKVIEAVLERSDLLIETIIPDSMPYSDAGLRPEQREAKRTLMTVAELIPGATHSTYMRFIGELIFRQDRYDSGDIFERTSDFIDTSSEIIEALSEERLPGTWLMIDQVLAISNSRVEERLAHIGELTEYSLQPTVIYLGTDEPGYDYMVNDGSSAENVCKFADSAGLECLIYNVPGAVHTRPDLANEEYVETITNAAPEIQAALSQALTRYYAMTNLYRPEGAI